MESNIMSESSNNAIQGNDEDLNAYCQSEFLSEHGLRIICEQRRLNNIDTHDKNDFFLQACTNERVDEGVIRCLIENFPHVASATHEDGITPLYCALANKRMTRGIVQLLIDAAPDSVGSVDNHGRMPLHVLCWNFRLDGTTAIKILKLLLEKHPESIRHADSEGLPIHIAARKGKSADFCRVLVEAYPGSIRVFDHTEKLPIHWACMYNTVATVEFLYNCFPDAINHTTAQGWHPIYSTLFSYRGRKNQDTAVEVVRFLLDCDPNVKLQKFRGMSLLHVACCLEYSFMIDIGVKFVNAIYDAHPEAIEDDEIAQNMNDIHPALQYFLSEGLVYARQAKNLRRMATPDLNGHLPLHRALQDNATLGSVKLLVKGNPRALQLPDNCGATPLHIACEHYSDSLSVIQYLVGLDTTILDAMDRNGDTALHYACRHARHDIIALFLDEFDAVSVSKRNAHKKLPIDLLWESNVESEESIEYIDSTFRLIKAYPETVMNYDSKHPAQTNNHGSGSSQDEKKRKLDAVIVTV